MIIHDLLGTIVVPPPGQTWHPDSSFFFFFNSEKEFSRSLTHKINDPRGELSDAYPTQLRPKQTRLWFTTKNVSRVVGNWRWNAPSCQIMSNLSNAGNSLLSLVQVWSLFLPQFLAALSYPYQLNQDFMVWNPSLLNPVWIHTFKGIRMILLFGN